MTDEKTAKKYLLDYYGKDDSRSYEEDHIKHFLAGIKHGERKGWDAAREETDLSIKGVHTLVGPKYETFENWEKEKEK